MIVGKVNTLNQKSSMGVINSTSGQIRTANTVSRNFESPTFTGAGRNVVVAGAGTAVVGFLLFLLTSCSIINSVTTDSVLSDNDLSKKVKQTFKDMGITNYDGKNIPDINYHEPKSGIDVSKKVEKQLDKSKIKYNVEVRYPSVSEPVNSKEEFYLTEDGTLMCRRYSSYGAPYDITLKVVTEDNMVKFIEPYHNSCVIGLKKERPGVIGSYSDSIDTGKLIKIEELTDYKLNGILISSLEKAKKAINLAMSNNAAGNNFQKLISPTKYDTIKHNFKDLNEAAKNIIKKNPGFSHYV